MKKILLTALVAFATLSSTEMLAQNGFGTNNPDKSAAVDIVSTKRGLLIPRVSLTSTTLAAPVAKPAQSLLVYNQNTEGDVTPGFYYWEYEVTKVGNEFITTDASGNFNNTSTGKWVRVMSSNIAKTSSVVEGNTTYVTSAPSTGNPLNTEYKVEVKDGAITTNKIANEAVTTDKIEPSEFKNDVLVTEWNDEEGVLVTKWVKLSQIINEEITAGTIEGKKLDSDGSIEVVGGETALLNDVTIKVKQDGISAVHINPDVAGDGLKQDAAGALAVDYEEAATGLGKNLTADESILVTGPLDEDGNPTYGAGALLKDVKIEVAADGIKNEHIADKAVTEEKLVADPLDITENRFAVADPAGNVEYKTITEAVGKGLTTDNVIQITGAGATNTQSATQSVLKDIKLEIGTDKITAAHIAENAVGTSEIAPLAVTNSELANNAVTSEKIIADGVKAVNINSDVAGTGLVQNATTGALEVELVASGIAKGLTTDNVIQITGTGATNTQSATASVLKDIKLEIGANAITNVHIADGTVRNEELAEEAVTTEKIKNNTILAEDMKSEGNSKVLVTNADGTVTWINQSDLGNTVTADNGLTKTNNNIRLGGNLEIATKITTAGDKTLAIENLKPVTMANSIVVVENLHTIKEDGKDVNVEGVLRTIARSIAKTISSDLTINATNFTGYSAYVQEVNISVDLAAADIDVNLPDAVAAKGQVISVKLTNTGEVAGYVNIKSGSTVLSYGSLPYQGWILKSNGENWSIVGRN